MHIETFKNTVYIEKSPWLQLPTIQRENKDVKCYVHFIILDLYFQISLIFGLMNRIIYSLSHSKTLRIGIHLAPSRIVNEDLFPATFKYASLRVFFTA